MYFLYKTADWRSPICILEGVNLRFGGCQFTFWRPKLSWGCFIEKGVLPPKRVVLWAPAKRPVARQGPTEIPDLVCP